MTCFMLSCEKRFMKAHETQSFIHFYANLFPKGLTFKRSLTKMKYIYLLPYTSFNHIIQTQKFCK